MKSTKRTFQDQRIQKIWLGLGWSRQRLLNFGSAEFPKDRKNNKQHLGSYYKSKRELESRLERNFAS